MTATTKTATVARTPNYSDSAVVTMIAEYSADPTRTTVDALARQFNKNPRSIIAKLVREGVYKALVTSICNSLGVDSIATLEKVSKTDLEALLSAITLRVVA